jgi:exopolysaccharide biosynthesis polyprenyl glycosylphosphotransferase
MALRAFILELSAPALTLGVLFPLLFLDLSTNPSSSQSSLVFSIFFFLAWVIIYTLNRTWDSDLLGTGTKEFSAILRSGLLVFLVVVLAEFLFRLEVPRLYFALTLVIGIILQILIRWITRKQLFAQRAHGNFLSPTLLVGPIESVLEFAQKMKQEAMAGWLPVAIWTKESSLQRNELAAIHNSGLSLINGEELTPESLLSNNIGTIVFLGTSDFPDEKIHQLSWQTQGAPIKFFVEPRLLKVPSSRIVPANMYDQVLLGVSSLRFDGPSVVAKRIFDLSFSLLAIFVTLPLQLVVAVLIIIVDRANPFFIQERIGQDGRSFSLVKFRTMRYNGDNTPLKAKFGNGDSGNLVQFKMREDPRVTVLGKILRRFSIDELPQFYNVLCGEMSVVGPRPHVLSEVQAYGSHENRRLRVKPGVTGLWQVNGRSTLTWDEAVAFDLNYVESWSLIGDIVIILRTIRAVAVGTGAY